MEKLWVEGRYKLIKKIGRGSFGEIFLGINVKTKAEHALKFEPVNAKYPILYKFLYISLVEEEKA